MNKIPVGKTIAYAYSFTFGQLGTIIGLCWLPLVVVAVLQFLPWAFGGNPMAPAESTGQEGQRALETLASLLLTLQLYAVMFIPVTRQALGLRQGGATVHFALGPPEFRVFGALLLFVLLFLMMSSGILILGKLATVGAAATKSAPLVLILALVELGAVLGFIYAIIRLGFLLVPVTVAEAQVSLTRGWLLTARNFWRICAVLLAVLLPLYLVWLVGVAAIAGPGLFAPLPADTAAAEQAMTLRFQLIGQRMPEILGLMLIMAPFVIGLLLGTSAFAYRALAPVPGSTSAEPAT